MCRFVLKRWFIICKYIQLYRYITIEKFGDSTCRCVLKSILYNLTSLLGFVIYCNRIKKYKVVVKSIHLRACHVMSYHLDAVTFFLYTLKHQQCCSDLHCFVLATELGSAACLLGRMLVWCGIRSWKPLVWCVHELSHVPYGQDFGCIHNMAKKMHGSWACDGDFSSFYHRNESLKVSQI